MKATKASSPWWPRCYCEASRQLAPEAGGRAIREELRPDMGGGPHPLRERRTGGAAVPRQDHRHWLPDPGLLPLQPLQHAHQARRRRLAGTITAFYLSSQNSEHDEIDFEFLGNRTEQPYILQTNVFSGGKGDREQRIYLWFDPTKDYHSYSVLWNLYMIAFFVDDTPIRVFKNSKDLGVRYPFDQPMKLYSSLWNADDWATRGGREKTDWSKAPFVASTGLPRRRLRRRRRKPRLCATRAPAGGSARVQDLDAAQYRRLAWVGKEHTIYNYCTDRERYAAMSPECKRDRDV
ncbi:hypothetical protein ZWY2020_028750 [Hordeum vulgare]|nr:hypothetical protein ZWY2020_028750 [Hordeum vulgare]